MLRKFERRMIHSFSSNSLDSGTNCKCWTFKAIMCPILGSMQIKPCGSCITREMVDTCLSRSSFVQ